MSKTEGTRTFRPWIETAKRLEYAEKLGVNVSELVNQVLAHHLKPYVEDVAKQREREIRKTLAAGVGHWSPHSCRHFFACRCIADGVDLPTVARWLGHADGGALLARTYFHLSDWHSRQAAGRVRIGQSAGIRTGRTVKPVTENHCAALVGSSSVGVNVHGCQSARLVLVNPCGVTTTASSHFKSGGSTG